MATQDTRSVLLVGSGSSVAHLPGPGFLSWKTTTGRVRLSPFSPMSSSQGRFWVHCDCCTLCSGYLYPSAAREMPILPTKQGAFSEWDLGRIPGVAHGAGM